MIKAIDWVSGGDASSLVTGYTENDRVCLICGGSSSSRTDARSLLWSDVWKGQIRTTAGVLDAGCEGPSHLGHRRIWPVDNSACLDMMEFRPTLPKDRLPYPEGVQEVHWLKRWVLTWIRQPGTALHPFSG